MDFDAFSYAVDAWQRSILFLDVMRTRAIQYEEQAEKTAPHVLDYEAELICDGRTLARPVNYALVRIVPPSNFSIDPRKRPFVVVDPRAGHGPGIGGFKADSEIGVAMKAGHACYFIGFLPEPQPGQTIEDIAAAEAVDQGAGILFIVKNYEGDLMNFEMAKEMAGRTIETVITDDDVAVEPLGELEQPDREIDGVAVRGRYRLGALLAGLAGLGLAQRDVDLLDAEHAFPDQHMVDRGDGHQQALELEIGDVHGVPPIDLASRTHERRFRSGSISLL